VELVDDLEHFDVKENGAAIRYGGFVEKRAVISTL
jgi:diaminopimelate epimerase